MANDEFREDQTTARQHGLVKRHETRLTRAQARESRNDPEAGHDWIITRRGDDVDIRIVDKAGSDITVPADVAEAWRLVDGLTEALRGTSRD